jgi:hypothetical protein
MSETCTAVHAPRRAVPIPRAASARATPRTVTCPLAWFHGSPAAHSQDNVPPRLCCLERRACGPRLAWDCQVSSLGPSPPVGIPSPLSDHFSLMLSYRRQDMNGELVGVRFINRGQETLAAAMTQSVAITCAQIATIPKNNASEASVATSSTTARPMSLTPFE